MSAVPRPPQASCLCGSAPCILCACCPASRNSTVSRLIFTVFLFLGVLVSIIMLSPGVESQLYKVSGPGGGAVPGLWGRLSRSRLGGPRLGVPANQEEVGRGGPRLAMGVVSSCGEEDVAAHGDSVSRKPSSPWEILLIIIAPRHWPRACSPRFDAHAQFGTP